MICEDFIPSPRLRPFVKCYHLRHFIFTGNTTQPFKPYAPRPEQTLAFFPRGTEWVEHPGNNKLIKRPAATIIGQYAERINRHLYGTEFCTLLVDFRPGMLYRLTGLPFHELTNNFIDAADIFNAAITRVNERLNSTNNYNEMIRIVETFLLSLVKNVKKDAHAIDNVTDLLIDNAGDASLLTMAKQSFLSSRQFERQFKARMGINPKLFTRIVRLNRAYRYKYNHPNEDWLSIALQFGYHDYQHLAKDFIDLAGSSPNTYFLEDTKAPEALFGLKDSSL